MGLFNFLAGLLGKLLGLWKAQPSRLEVQTGRAAVAETELQAKVQNDHAVEAALAAADAVRAEQLRSPDREALARSADPYSRD